MQPTWYQMPGIVGARCGSLARIGLPVDECVPSTTQELEPMPSPVPSSAGSAAAASRAFAREAPTTRSLVGGFVAFLPIELSRGLVTIGSWLRGGSG